MATHEKDQTNVRADAPRADKPWLWKPGQSGNPRGRPDDIKRLGLDAYIRDNVPWDQLVEALIKIAINKDMTARPQDSLAAMKILAERGFGKVKTAIELTAKVDPGSVIDIDALDDASADMLERALLGAIEATLEGEPDTAAARALALPGAP